MRGHFRYVISEIRCLSRKDADNDVLSIWSRGKFAGHLSLEKGDGEKVEQYLLGLGIGDHEGNSDGAKSEWGWSPGDLRD